LQRSVMETRRSWITRPWLSVSGGYGVSLEATDREAAAIG
jgi:hypothetical protein